MTLRPGQALYVPAGRLHSYLFGVAVEVMGSADNVFRAGLTSKPVDVEALLEVVEFAPAKPGVLRARKQGPEQVYDTPAREFRLSRLDLGRPVAIYPSGPEILLAIDGEATLLSSDTATRLTSGQSAFVAGTGRPVVVQGDATVFRARIGADVEVAGQSLPKRVTDLAGST